MQSRRALTIAVASVVSLAACGGNGDDAETAETSVLDSADAAATLPVPAPTDPPPTDPATTVTTAPATTTPPTTIPESGCLEGSWWLSPEETTSLYSALLPGIPVTVTGTHWVEFAGDTVDYWAVLEMRFAVGGIDVTFGLDQHGVGTYTVTDDVLAMNYDTFESTFHEGHGVAITDPDRDPASYANEAVELTDNGDGTITINSVTIPKIDVAPVAGGPMGCDDETMSLGFTSGLADTAAVYVRRS
jgi:hypothetical protein